MTTITLETNTQKVRWTLEETASAKDSRMAEELDQFALLQTKMAERCASASFRAYKLSSALVAAQSRVRATITFFFQLF